MNSKEYWAKREAEQLKHYITDEKEYDRQIKQIYTITLDNVQKEIDSFYGKYAAKEKITLAEAKKRVAELDVKAFERKAAQYVKDKDFSKRANEELRLYNATMKINRLEMLKANIGLELISGTEELNKYMEGILQGRTIEELQRQAGILGKTIKSNAAKAHAIVNSSFHNATFSDRIWLYQDLLKAQLSSLLQTGLIQGKNPRELARSVKKTFTTSTYNAERLMRTELARVQTEAQKQSFERNGFTMYEFIVNGGCCPICAALSGKHFKVDKMMPGENAPPMHPHCRCSTAAWEDSAEYNAWLEYLNKGGTSVEWDKYKSASALKLAEDIKISKKQTNNSYSVNRSLVNSQKYYEKFDELPINKNVRQAAYYESKIILEHRDGSNFEDVVVIDSRTGKFIVKNDTYEEAFKSAMTAEEFSKVKNHKGNVVIIHNHAEGTRLSKTDIFTAFSTKNVEMSIAVGHNGAVHCIYDIDRKINIDKIYNTVYNNILEEFGNKELAAIKATDALYRSGAFKYSEW